MPKTNPDKLAVAIAEVQLGITDAKFDQHFDQIMDAVLNETPPKPGGLVPSTPPARPPLGLVR